MRALRVVLADDHALILSAIRLMIERIEGVTVVAEASNGRDAVALALRHRPDLVIMDISMNDMNGIEATAQITAQSPVTRVMILSSHVTEEVVRRAILAGAAGYLSKGCQAGELASAIQSIAEGNPYLDQSISARILSRTHGPGEPIDSPLDALTGRQREVLQMIAEGKSTKEIAFALALSVKTVESHRAAIMDRLCVRDVAGLTLFAARHGLVEVDRDLPR